MTKRKKYISVKEDRRMFLHIYEVVKRKGEEESNLIILMGSKNIRKYYETRLGKISILSRLDVDGDRLYRLYKSREDVEQSFDAMKTN
ncbi:MAG: hypothetical protein QW292_05630 [Candidatus Parvarchaeota archaeon]